MKISIKTKPTKVEHLVGKADETALNLSDQFLEQITKILEQTALQVEQLALNKGMVANGRLLSDRKTLINALHAQDQIEQLLHTAGYGHLIEDHFKGYEALLSQGKELYASLWPGFEWSKADLTMLQTYQLMDFSQFGKIGKDAAATVATTLYQSSLAGRSFADMKAEIRASLDLDLKRYAHTYAQDSLMGYNRAMDTVVAKDLNPGFYYFTGTIMGATRSWCASHVGKTYSKKEVEGWNGQSWKGKKPGDVRIVLGGWNCRHRLIPVSKEWADQHQVPVNPPPPPAPKKEPAKEPKPEPKKPSPQAPGKIPAIGSLEDLTLRGYQARGQAVGEAYGLPDHKATLDDVNARAAAFTKGLGERYGENAAWPASEMKEIQNLFAQRREAESALAQAMGALREDLLARRTKEEAQKGLQGVRLGARVNNERFKESVAEFHQLLGPQATPKLKSVTVAGDRAWAQLGTGKLNVGGGSKSSVWHELGHFAEWGKQPAMTWGRDDYYNNPIATASHAFIKSKAKGPAKRLRDLIPGSNYGPGEIAFEDGFVSPYVGKIYHDAATEVFSMGVQHFSFPGEMKNLYQGDQEHFNFILGVITA